MTNLSVLKTDLIEVVTVKPQYFTTLLSNVSARANTPDYACLSVQQNTLHHQVFLFSSLLFIAAGLIGNILSIVVFSSAKMRSVSAHCYLVALAVSDSVYLLSAFLTHGLTTIRCLYFPDVPMDILHRSTVSCISMQLLLDIFGDFSPCVILTVTVERYLACCYPQRFNNICTVNQAKICSVVTFVICVLVSTPYHIMYMKAYNEYNICTVNTDYELEFTIWYSIEAIVLRILPIFIVAILNVFIILRITSTTGPSNSQMHLTIMLLLVSSSYIILYLPILILFVLQKFMRSDVIQIDHTTMDIVKCYAKVFYILSFAINFFLYAFTRKTFRDQLKHLLCSCLSKKLNAVASRDKDTDVSQL